MDEVRGTLTLTQELEKDLSIDTLLEHECYIDNIEKTIVVTQRIGGEVLIDYGSSSGE